MTSRDLEHSLDDLVDELIVAATRVAFESIDRPDPVTVRSAIDLLNLLALADVRLVPDQRGLSRRAIRRIEHDRGLL